MNTQTMLHLGLTVHLIALTMVVGVLIASAVTSNQFWKLYDCNNNPGLAIFTAIKKFQVIGMIGLLLLILSGISMLWLYHGGFGGQLWFKIKMTTLLAILINGFTLGRSVTLKFEKVLKEENVPGSIAKLRRNQKIFYLTQFSFFLLIIVLASFRFI